MARVLENTSGLEPFLVETIKASAISRAAKLCLDCDVGGRLGLSVNQSQLFVNYLAAGIVRQEGHEESGWARDPRANVIRNMPFLGWVLNFLVFDWHEANQVVEAELLTEATGQLEQMRQKAVNAAAEKPETVVPASIQVDLSDFLRDYVNGLISSEINPTALQRAANTTASTYLNKKGRPEDLRDAMERTLSRIVINRPARGEK